MAVPDAAINTLFGPWLGAIVIIAVPLIGWIVKSISVAVSSRQGALPGSPSSERYWRSRLAEALEHLKKVPEAPEHEQFEARVTEARIMVEAHEAKRRVGVGGVRSLWVLVILLAVTASVSWVAAAAEQSWALGAFAMLLVGLMIAVELLALIVSSAGTERFNVLVAAGRFGRSDLVRADPWRVLREYDYARHRAGRKYRLKGRTQQDKDSTSRWIRFERSMIGVSPWQNGLAIAADEIWAPVPVTTTQVKQTSPSEMAAAS